MLWSTATATVGKHGRSIGFLFGVCLGNYLLSADHRHSRYVLEKPKCQVDRPIQLRRQYFLYVYVGVVPCCVTE